MYIVFVIFYEYYVLLLDKSNYCSDHENDLPNSFVIYIILHKQKQLSFGKLILYFLCQVVMLVCYTVIHIWECHQLN